MPHSLVSAVVLAASIFLLGCQPDQQEQAQPKTQEHDLDQDGIADHLDDDIDGDGLLNSEDPDDDNDTVNDEDDAFPHDPLEQLDTDLDGVGNNLDTDDDNDTHPDTSDAFPLNSREWANHDGDPLGDNFDPDDDDDGVDDILDAFPYDASEQLDTDSDGIGNNADPDDDNDGTHDLADAFPLDPTEFQDSDHDDIGNVADLDDDNDGTPDSADAFPLDPNESLDSDGDLIGNNFDPDDDNDGVADDEDIAPLISSQSTAPVWTVAADQRWTSMTLVGEIQHVAQLEVAFVNDDLLKDIVILHENELALLLQQNDGSFNRVSISSNTYYGEFYVGNLDADPELEIVANDISTSALMQFDYIDDTNWSSTEIVSSTTLFGIVDSDADGILEVAYTESTRMYFNETGVQHSEYCRYGRSAMTEVNFPGEATNSLVLSTSSGVVYRCDQEYFRIQPTSISNLTVEVIASDDLNRDGQPDLLLAGNKLIILGSTNDTYYIQQSFGEGENVHALAIGNFVANSLPEILYIADASHELRLLTADNNNATSYSTTTLADGLINASNIALSDWDADGQLDVVLSSEAFGIQVFSAPTAEQNLFVLSGESFNFDASAADADGNELSYRLINSYDSVLFSIDSQTGELVSNNALESSAPNDEDANNVYELTIAVSDGFVEISKTLSVTVR